MCMVEIDKAENGYVIEVRVPLKEDAKSSPMMDSCCMEEKKYVAKDAAEVLDLLEDILPLLDSEYTDEKAFDKAFEKAVGVEDEKE
jgi:hypothetical protein